MSALINKLRSGSNLICLDYLKYARGLFGSGESCWFEGAQLLNLIRQGQQALRADVVLLPLLDWMQAWSSAHPNAIFQGRTPSKILKNICTDPALTASLHDTLLALATMHGTERISLLVDDPARWLAWAADSDNVDEILDENQVEDVAVYLSALLHQLPMGEVGALFIRQDSMLDGDIGPAYASLTNTARHYGVASVFCAPSLLAAPLDFDCYASDSPDATNGRIMQQSDWEQPQSLSAPFAIGVVPDKALPQNVLKALACWRNQS